MLTNTDIRARAAENNVRLWQIAEELNINDGNFSRKLRKVLSDIEKKRIFIIIDEIAAEKENAAHSVTSTTNG